MAGSIFEKHASLKPSAMRTVAERRFGDAQALCDTGDNARANGVAYLAGFVIEILLKARLVEKFPVIARKRQHAVNDDERRVWSLIWRQHDLRGLSVALPETTAVLRKRSEIERYNYLADLIDLCNTWTVHARYSPQSMRMDEAAAILGRVRRLKELLK